MKEIIIILYTSYYTAILQDFVIEGNSCVIESVGKGGGGGLQYSQPLQLSVIDEMKHVCLNLEELFWDILMQYNNEITTS